MSIEALQATWKLTKSQVTSTEKFFLLSCADRAGEEMECWPSVARLCADTGLDRKTVMDVRQRVIEKGLMKFTGEMRGRTKLIPVMKLTYVNNLRGQESNSTENGTGNSTENGTSNSTENGTLNLKEEPTKEPKRKAASNQDCLLVSVDNSRPLLLDEKKINKTTRESFTQYCKDGKKATKELVDPVLRYDMYGLIKSIMKDKLERCDLISTLDKITETVLDKYLSMTKKPSLVGARAYADKEFASKWKMKKRKV